MTRYSPRLLVYIITLSTFLQPHQSHCLRRLTRRKLCAEDISDRMTADNIRNIVSSSLASSDPQIVDNKKRDTSSDQAEDAASFDTLAEGNVAAESKDNSMYEDDVDEDDGAQQLVQQQLDYSEYKRSVDPSSVSDLAERSMDQSDLAAYDEPDGKVMKGVSKREAKSEDDYDEEIDVNANSPESSSSVDRKDTRSALPESNEDSGKRETPMEASAEADSDLDYQKQIEDQIQQRIDSIKDDIKREIERKQRIREIEANNAKYDELEFNRETGDLNDNAVDDDQSSLKRSIFRDSAATSNNAGRVVETDSSMRIKRSGLGDLSEVAKGEENKDTPLVVPVKKRSFARRVTLVEKRDFGDAKKRQSRSASILIPERGHAEVKDELPGDLILDPSLRIGRSDEEKNVRNTRSARYSRDLPDELENGKVMVNDAVDEPNNFLFAAREKPDCQMRRRRSRSRNRMRSMDRRKTRKRPRHSRRHRTVRASSMEDEEPDEEERDKREMSIDEDAALEYKESFGGFQSESEGAGRFKRIKRSAKIS